MKIELTKKQYKTLLTIMYCGEWMLNSYKDNDDDISKETDDIEQIMYSFAKDSGLEKWIEYDSEMRKYFPTADMEDELHKFIDIFNLKQRSQ
ncbi:hypothetical protein [Maribacter hydrothermalis]|uniref:Uncharacterized protein n=1 Tax=Maribacter hydrothermalis TaxID=1836467 RepID=A0A1B7ZEG3_9FLAO|nr:hypothetical protein [Maribacter hydrothermalis]APQ17460.1 hypothetical protein BTR34_09040 [Maribacter hydrothermalis]OBR41938.1 hypothetical protein A9200_00680 [Maribacter hydrothermalis]